MSNFIEDARRFAIRCIEEGEQILVSDEVAESMYYSNQNISTL